MIELEHKGDFSKTIEFLRSISAGQKKYRNVLDKYGRIGVQALSAATPKRTGKTSESWSYQIEESTNEVKVVWTNTNIVTGVNIALILQYGHATRNGGYVEGLDYINPALRSVFSNMADEAWKVVVEK